MHAVGRILRRGLVPAMLAAAAAARAHEAPAPPANPYAQLTLEELLALDVTSVSRRPERLLDAASAVAVITPEDIRRSGHTSLPELLRLAPGLSVARINSSIWSVTSRGFAGEHANMLLVMVDGRSVYSPLFSGVFWDEQDIFLPDVERVEVVRGPGGTMWGANAVNGVINVISRSAKETQGNLVQAIGGTEEWGGAARFGGVLGENAWYRVYGQYRGYDNSVDPGGAGFHDAWHHARGGLRADWEATPQDTLTLNAEYGAGRAGEYAYLPTLTPPSTPAVETARDLASGFLLARWVHDTPDGLDWTAQLYYDRAGRDSAGFGAVVNTVDLSLEGRFQPLEGHDVVFGLGYRTIQDAIDSTFLIQADPERRRTGVASAFLQDTLSIVPDRLRLIAGAKAEHNDYSGFEIQPSGRLLWTPDDRQTAWAAVSRAVRTPNRYESDFTMNYAVAPGAPPTVLRTQPNEDLDAVDLLAVEAGYRARLLDDLFFDLALFHCQYEDLIISQASPPFLEPAPPPPHLVVPSTYRNAMHGTSFGGELAATWHPADGWRVVASYSHLHMRLRSEPPGENAEGLAGDSPAHQFQIRAGTDLPHGLAADAAAYFVDDLRGQGVDAYVRLDVRLAWKPVEGLEVSLVGRNLLEARHPEFVSYTMPAAEIQRSVYAAVTWQF